MVKEDDFNYYSTFLGYCPENNVEFGINVGEVCRRTIK